MATHTITIPDWLPVTLNRLMHAHYMARVRVRHADYDMVAAYAMQAGVPEAVGKRRVSLTLVLGPKQRARDEDGVWKVLLDGLVRCNRLLDDGPEHVELGPVRFERGPAKATVITLEDVP